MTKRPEYLIQFRVVLDDNLELSEMVPEFHKCSETDQLKVWTEHGVYLGTAGELREREFQGLPKWDRYPGPWPERVTVSSEDELF